MNTEKGALKQKPDFEEKRSFPRFKVECPATFQIEGKDRVIPIVVRELSATGLGVIGSEAVEVGRVVSVAMTPEAGTVPPLQMKAVVVRCEMEGKGYRMGLKILQMLPGL